MNETLAAACLGLVVCSLCLATLGLLISPFILSSRISREEERRGAWPMAYKKGGEAKQH